MWHFLAFLKIVAQIYGQNSTLYIWDVKFTKLKLSKHAYFFFIPVKVQSPQHVFAKVGSVGRECVLPTPWLCEVWKLLVFWICSHLLWEPFKIWFFFFFFSSWLQIDLEPEGRVYVIIDLSGSSGEGRAFQYFILLFCEWDLQGSLQWKCLKKCVLISSNLYKLKLKWAPFVLCLWVNKQLLFVLPC